MLSYAEEKSSTIWDTRIESETNRNHPLIVSKILDIVITKKCQLHDTLEEGSSSQSQSHPTEMKNVS